MSTNLLFVYGTLLSAYDNPQADRLRNQAECLGRASFCGRLYEIDNYPGAVLSDKKEERVWGELWQIHTEPEELLSWLDHYEECSSAYPEPHEYRRCQISVRHQDGRHLSAWCWLYNRPHEGLKPIPGGDYRERPGRYPGADDNFFR